MSKSFVIRFNMDEGEYIHGILLVEDKYGHIREVEIEPIEEPEIKPEDPCPKCGAETDTTHGLGWCVTSCRSCDYRERRNLHIVGEIMR